MKIKIPETYKCHCTKCVCRRYATYPSISKEKICGSCIMGDHKGFDE